MMRLTLGLFASVLALITGYAVVAPATSGQADRGSASAPLPSVRPSPTTAATTKTKTPSVPTATPTKPITANAAAPVEASHPQPCVTNNQDQFVFVSIRDQRMWLCARHNVVREIPVTTGQDVPDRRTPTGNYQIQGRNRDSVLYPSDGAAYHVKYWIPFDAPNFGFHDSSWQTFPYGSDQYRTHGSHGCVHMPLAAITYFYNWVEIGASVTIAA